MESSSSDAQRLEEERVQKLNVLMSQVGGASATNSSSSSSSKIPAPDSSALLTSKDVAPLRDSMLQRPPDSYILNGLRWVFRSVKASVASSYAPTSQLQPSAAGDEFGTQEAEQKAEKERQEALFRQEEEERLRKQAAAAAAAKEEFRTSADGRKLTKTLTDEQAALLHPKIAAPRLDILEMEKKSHETLDRVMRNRVTYLALPEADPPCTAEMRVVADCYAQFAGRKYEAAVYLEKQNKTPEIIRRQQLADQLAKEETMPKGKSKQQQQQQQQKKKQDPYADLPEELMAGPQLVRLSTSVLACREVAKQLSQCTEQAGLAYLEKHHKRA